MRVRKILLKLDYMSSRSNHVMLDTFSTGREGEAVYLLVQWLYAIMSVALRYTTSKSCLLIHVYCKSTSCFSKSTLLTKRVFPEEVGITVPKRHGDGHLHDHHDDDSLAGHRATSEDAPSQFQRQQKRSSVVISRASDTHLPRTVLFVRRSLPSTMTPPRRRQSRSGRSPRSPRSTY